MRTWVENFMERWWNRASCSALLVVGLSVPLAGCDGGVGDGSGPGSGSGSDSDSDSNSSLSATSTSIETESETESPIGWFEVGWGEDDYTPVADGDPFPIVRGGQGAQMFPMPLRGAEFYLPSDPTSWMDETGPLVDLEMDVEGYNTGLQGHFKYIANYTLDWVVLDDGTYQSSWMPIIVPDGIDTDELDGLPAHLWVRLRPYEQPALELELDVVITVLTERSG